MARREALLSSEHSTGTSPGFGSTDPFGKKLEGHPFDEKSGKEMIRLNDDQPVRSALV